MLTQIRQNFSERSTVVLRCLIEAFGRLHIHRFVLNTSVYIRESFSCIWHTRCNTFFGMTNTSGRIFFRFLITWKSNLSFFCNLAKTLSVGIDYLVSLMLTDKTKFLGKILCSIEMSHWGFRSTTYSPFCFEHIRLYKGGQFYIFIMHIFIPFSVCYIYFRRSPVS
jgi:fluoride ion exporter CrcB/FEX